MPFLFAAGPEEEVGKNQDLAFNLKPMLLRILINTAGKEEFGNLVRD